MDPKLLRPDMVFTMNVDGQPVEIGAEIALCPERKKVARVRVRGLLMAR